MHFSIIGYDGKNTKRPFGTTLAKLTTKIQIVIMCTKNIQWHQKITGFNINLKYKPNAFPKEAW